MPFLPKHRFRRLLRRGVDPQVDARFTALARVACLEQGHPIAFIALATLPHLAPVWEGLSEEVRTSLARMSLHSSLVFRNEFGGSEEEALELVLECGGSESGVQGLRRLWALAGVVCCK